VARCFRFLLCIQGEGHVRETALLAQSRTKRRSVLVHVKDQRAVLDLEESEDPGARKARVSKDSSSPCALARFLRVHASDAWLDL
jgi:hypothetical protein